MTSEMAKLETTIMLSDFPAGFCGRFTPADYKRYPMMEYFHYYSSGRKAVQRLLHPLSLQAGINRIVNEIGGRSDFLYYWFESEEW
jgi:hypothetical protein